MTLRDRIVEFRRVPARLLRPNPKNWRTHPPEQRDALAGVLAEVGYVDALLARRLPDGSLMLLDGHLRADLSSEIASDTEVPVLIVDLDEAEADKVLATLDPLTGMAGIEREKLAELVQGIETKSRAVEQMLADLMEEGLPLPTSTAPLELDPLWQVIVDCDSEESQRAVFEELCRAGRSCRLLTLY